MMRKPLLGLSMMPEAEFVSAALPLLENNSVEVLEWSFDTLFNTNEPDWLRDLLNFYAENDRLIGHGVYYSLFDAQWTDRQEIWLSRLKDEVSKRNYNHITEHFGFMNTENFHQGVPLPVPLHPITLQIGQDRLQRLQDAVNIPVGIENLAFSFCLDDVKEQGIFLEKLIDNSGGFLILDLHNMYCQSCNFDVDIQEIIKLYPLQKVKEIHLSGGSWQESVYGKKMIRRDTHDHTIPEEIFAILPFVLSHCENLEYIIIERLGHTIKTKEEEDDFFSDFMRVKTMIDSSAGHERQGDLWIKKEFELSKYPVEDPVLYEEQSRLTKLLFDGTHVDSIKTENFHYFNTAGWDPEMIFTAQEIIKKWNPY